MNVDGNNSESTIDTGHPDIEVKFENYITESQETGMKSYLDGIGEDPKYSVISPDQPLPVQCTLRRIIDHPENISKDVKNIMSMYPQYGGEYQEASLQGHLSSMDKYNDSVIKRRNVPDYSINIVKEHIPETHPRYGLEMYNAVGAKNSVLDTEIQYGFKKIMHGLEVPVDVVEAMIQERYQNNPKKLTRKMHELHEIIKNQPDTTVDYLVSQVEEHGGLGGAITAIEGVFHQDTSEYRAAEARLIIANRDHFISIVEEIIEYRESGLSALDYPSQDDPDGFHHVPKNPGATVEHYIDPTYPDYEPLCDRLKNAEDNFPKHELDKWLREIADGKDLNLEMVEERCGEYPGYPSLFEEAITAGEFSRFNDNLLRWPPKSG